MDTGATFTVIDREVFDELGVLPSGMTDLLGVLGAPQSCPVYRVSAAMRVTGADKAASFHLPLRAIGIPPSMHRITKAHRGLLGRDFLRSGSFLYDGAAGRFELYLDIEQ